MTRYGAHGFARAALAIGWLAAAAGGALASEAQATVADEDRLAIGFTAEVDQATTEADADGREDAAACDSEPCEADACDKEGDPDADEPSGASAAVEEEGDDVVRPTHKQVRIIKVLSSDLPTRELKTFCSTPDGQILAACAGDDSGDVRLFDPMGESLGSWELPFEPEAINIGSDGRVYVAGDAKLARFTLEGELVNEGKLPHAEALLADLDGIREEVIESHKRQRESFTQYLDQIDEQIAAIEERIAAAEEAEAAETADDEAAPSDDDDPVAAAVARAARLLGGGGGAADTSRDEMMLKAMQSNRDSIQEMVDRQGGAELTDEQVEEKVNASIAYKLRVASISEADGEVFVATGAEKGYGFCVWRTNRWFENGEKIVGSLSGCCGQMDVQACRDGVFVAENGRHSVRRFDRDGERITSWGSSARSGVEGFGGCCNPMNVAFGPDASVYTAESETGRIKRFTGEGELIDLVGKVDLVPGCKKVSIAVGPGGDRVHMLDITRNHIVVMERLGEGERVSYSEKRGGGVSGLLGQFLEAFTGGG